MAALSAVGPYTIIQEIGSGSFATVFKARHNTSGLYVAIKSIRRSRLNPKLWTNLEAEITILKSFDHPNIVKLYAIESNDTHIFLILEYCGGGDLASFIRSRGSRPMPEALAKYFMRQLAAGLEFVHQLNVIHRDLKPSNLLLSEASESAVLKIADFGFARFMIEDGLAETLCGSPLYMAPEILRFQKYDAKADLWSVGVILFELLTGKPPFKADHQKQLLENIEKMELRLPKGVSISDSCLQILQLLLRRDPIHRLSYQDFFAHRFLDFAHYARPNVSNVSLAANLSLTSAPVPAVSPPVVRPTTMSAPFPTATVQPPTPVQLPYVASPPTTTTTATTVGPESLNVRRSGAEDESSSYVYVQTAPITSSQTSLTGTSPPGPTGLPPAAPGSNFRPVLTEFSGAQSQGSHGSHSHSHISPRTQHHRMLKELVQQVDVTMDLAEQLTNDAKRGEAFAVYLGLLRLLQQATHSLRRMVTTIPRARSQSNPPLPGSLSSGSEVSSQVRPPPADRHVVSLYKWLKTQFDVCLSRADSLQSTLPQDQIVVNAQQVIYQHALEQGRQAAVEEVLGNLSQSIAKYHGSLALFQQLARETASDPEDERVVSSYILTLNKRIQDADAQSKRSSPQL
eukprot:TRINITY_DN6813_c0_g1_i1.p1 TRINITY_DN6813_c0_g1~~TRINITY_DN6813_c0_g1_i1.p1  ORF type:complete len:627 (-),score=92.98 TRINITY_DN6813_c0_g1_i1:153-2033(-)